MTTFDANNPDEHRHAKVLLLAGPLIWFACFALVYLITGTGCTFDFATSSINGLNTLRLLAVCVTLLAAILAAWSTYSAINSWRNLHRTMIPASELPLRQRQEFLYITGSVLSLVSLIAVLWLATTIIMSPIC